MIVNFFFIKIIFKIIFIIIIIKDNKFAIYKNTLIDDKWMKKKTEMNKKN